MATPRISGGFARGSRGRAGLAGRNANEQMAEINRRYSDIIKRMRDHTPSYLRQLMEPVFDKTQDYVPVRTGNLKATGQLWVGRMSPRVFGAQITYGSAHVSYAAIVHERTDIHHTPPTRAKYIQSAMEEEVDEFLSKVAAFYLIDMRI